MKYVILKVKQGSGGEEVVRELPVIFPNELVHFDVAESLKRICHRNLSAQTVDVVSAGFVNSMEVDVNCYGRSESLNKESRQEDSFLIQHLDYTHGIL